MALEIGCVSEDREASGTASLIETGLGPNTGAYYVLLNGQKGDLIGIKIDGIDDLYLMLL